VIEHEGAGTLSVHAWLYDLHTGTILAFDEPSKEWRTVAEQTL
jgi:hypothetical protein